MHDRVPYPSKSISDVEFVLNHIEKLLGLCPVGPALGNEMNPELPLNCTEPPAVRVTGLPAQTTVSLAEIFAPETEIVMLSVHVTPLSTDVTV